MKMLMEYDGVYLFPTSEDSVESYERLRKGRSYSVEVKQARNPQFHRKGFKLLHTLFENQERYTNFEDFLVEIKLVTGHYAEHITNKGAVIYVPKSLNFASMDNTAFETFYNKVVDIAFEKLGAESALGFV